MAAFILRACLFVAVWYIGYTIGVNHEREKHNNDNKDSIGNLTKQIQDAAAAQLLEMGKIMDTDSKKMGEFHEFVKDLEKYTELMKIMGELKQ